MINRALNQACQQILINKKIHLITIFNLIMKKKIFLK